jgi:hypothetical protein
VACGLLPQQRHVDAPVEVGEEDLLAVVPPLRDVMRCADRDHASDTRHGMIVPDRAKWVKSLGDCPFFGALFWGPVLGSDSSVELR